MSGWQSEKFKPGDKVIVTGGSERGIGAGGYHFIKEGVLCEVLDTEVHGVWAAEGEVYVCPVDNDADKWSDGTRQDYNYVHEVDLVHAVVIDPSNLDEVEAFLNG